MQSDPVYLTAQELAERHRCDVATLANQRSRGEGIPWTKVTGRVLYRLADVLEAEAAGRRAFSWSRLETAVDRAELAPGDRARLMSVLERELRA